MSRLLSLRDGSGLASRRRVKFQNGSLTTPLIVPVFKIPMAHTQWAKFKEKCRPECMMFNAAILAGSWGRKRVSAEGIHAYLDYKGLVFSDGGGFSKFSKEFGQLELLSFQTRIGVDFATTLDFPVNLSKIWFDRGRALRSIDNAVRASSAPRGKTKLLASIHARSSLEAVSVIRYLESHGEFDGYALGSMLSKGLSMPEITSIVAAARKAIGEKYLHVYGLFGAAVHHLMFLAGADSVDSHGFDLSAARRQYYSGGGHTLKKRQVEEMRPTCSCEVCRTVGDPLALTRDELTIHNFLVVQGELKEAREALDRGEYTRYLSSKFRDNVFLHRSLLHVAKLSLGISGLAI